jgi:hypothetical protein
MACSTTQATFASRKREAGRGVFNLLFLLAYAFTVPITFLTTQYAIFHDRVLVHDGVLVRLPVSQPARLPFHL